MTINSQVRTAGPFAGTGTVATYPFEFKIFAASDLLVARTNADASQVFLVLNADYSVALNSNQDVAPGGTITLLGGNLPIGTSLSMTSNVPRLQTASLSNNGGFFPKVIEAALDRTIILMQQIFQGASQALRVPDITGVAELPGNAARAGRLVAFDPSSGAPVVTSFTVAQLQNATVNFPSPDAGKVLRWRLDGSGLLENVAASDNPGLQALLAGSGGAAMVGSANGQTVQARMDALAVGLGLRNRIINGGMRIDQRYRGAVHTIQGNAAAVAYYLDRFYSFAGGAPITGQQVVAAGIARYRLTGAAGNTGWYIGQRIEASNSADLAGQSVTIQAKLSSSSLTSTTWSLYRANTTDAFGSPGTPTRTLIAQGTFTGVSATETRFSTTVDVPPDATTGLELLINGGALLAGQTVTIGDVQLEPGTAVLPFEQRLMGTELALCQRYCPGFYVNTGGTVGTGVQGIATAFQLVVPFPVPTRVPATSLLISSSNAFTVITAATTTCTNITLTAASSESAELQLTVNGTTGQAGVVRATGVINFYFGGCEL